MSFKCPLYLRKVASSCSSRLILVKTLVEKYLCFSDYPFVDKVGGVFFARSIIFSLLDKALRAKIKTRANFN